ncbi:hypothetical protein V1478_008946 [Vespula squamosa]|uniref:Uncharacterized protein n=1 Tax=Vespula squamosa TaxID=30214 RepID=A0ABD2AV11_VESSQ
MLLKVRRCISLEKSKRARNESKGSPGNWYWYWCYNIFLVLHPDVSYSFGCCVGSRSALGNVPPKEDTSRCHELEEF